MKTTLLTLVSLLILFALHSCSQNGAHWESLFGEDYALAEYEDGSWEVKDDAIVAYEDMALWAKGEYENFRLDLSL